MELLSVIVAVVAVAGALFYIPLHRKKEETILDKIRKRGYEDEIFK